VSPGLVIVLAVAAAVPLLLGLVPALRLPGALLEIVVGVLIGPSVLGWVTPDATVEALALLGL
jgi:Kef-type K+ transport system membrane component KefB